MQHAVDGKGWPKKASVSTRGRDSPQLHPTCRSRGSRRRQIAGREPIVRGTISRSHGGFNTTLAARNVVMSYSGESCARNRRCAARRSATARGPTTDSSSFPPSTVGIIRPALFFSRCLFSLPHRSLGQACRMHFVRRLFSRDFVAANESLGDVYPGSKLISVILAGLQIREACHPLPRKITSSFIF